MDKYFYKCSNCGKFFERPSDWAKFDQEKIKRGKKPDVMSCSENCTKILALKHIEKISKNGKLENKIYTFEVIDNY